MKIKDILYGLFLLVGIMAGLYGIAFDLIVLQIIGVFMVFIVPASIVLVRYIFRMS